MLRSGTEGSCRRTLALMLDPGDGQMVRTRAAHRVVQRDGVGDICCAEADPLKDKRHERLEVDTRIALPWDTQVLSAGGPLGLGYHRGERLAGIDVAGAILVTDKPAPPSVAFEHRQQIGPARLGATGGPAAPRRADLGDGVPGRDVNDRGPVGGAAVAQSADIQRRGQDAAHCEQRQAEPGCDLPVREAFQGQGERMFGHLDPLWIDFDELALVAPEAKRWATTRVALGGELGREALLDPAAMTAQPGLGRLRQIDQLIPVPLATAEDLLVAEPDRHARRMKLVFEDVECLTEIALPAIDVGGDEKAVGASLSRRDRLAHGLVQIDGRPGASNAELDAG